MRYVSSAARGIRRGVSSAARATPVLARDLTGLAGAGAMVYGIALIYVPAAFIFGGVMAMTAAFALARRSN